ncbi:uncharacterized protein [Panulirus ornatus]|uniref:uncharacterized protein n=1 Tax=Panulirus ornatus TaxID=150431 RepID=UPI003A8B4D15
MVTVYLLALLVSLATVVRGGVVSQVALAGRQLGSGDDQPLQCQDTITIDFSSGFPHVNCSSPCQQQLNTSVAGSVYKREDRLAEYGVMLKLEYDLDGQLNCSLVEDQPDFHLLQIRMHNEACHGGSSQVPSSSGSTQVPSGSGSTQVPGGSGSTQVPGGSGSTQVPSGSGSTQVPGGSGSTQVPVPGGSGSSQVPVGSGSTHVPGGSGSTQVPGGSGSTQVPGGSGSTQVPGGSGSTQVPGGSGSTQVPGGSGSTQVPGGSGSTQVPGGSGSTQVPGGSGSTQVPGGSGSTQVPGGSGSTQVPGGSGSTQVPGGSGSTQVPGGSGSTQVPGGSGSTQVPGGSGSTQVPGGSGSTQVPGGSGSTQVPGGSGSTQVPGGSGSTQVPGGSGSTGGLSKEPPTTVATVSPTSGHTDEAPVNPDCGNNVQGQAGAGNAVAQETDATEEASDTTTKTLPTTVPTTRTTTISLVCPAGWELFSSSCYHFTTKRTGSWQEGRDYCASINGAYVKITNLTEFNFVKSRLTDNTWIGLNDLEKEGVFVWDSDKSLVSFKKWASGEPNGNMFIGEDCVEMHKGKNYDWNDESCGSNRRYACERSAIVLLG